MMESAAAAADAAEFAAAVETAVAYSAAKLWPFDQSDEIHSNRKWANRGESAERRDSNLTPVTL